MAVEAPRLDETIRRVERNIVLRELVPNHSGIATHWKWPIVYIEQIYGITLYLAYMPTGVVNHHLPIVDALEDQCEDLSIVPVTNYEEVVSTLANAEFLICSSSGWDDYFLEGLAPGNWIQTTSAGYDTFPINEFHDCGITFTNATGIHGPIVAEHVFALAFAFSRMIPEFISKQTEQVWGPRPEVSHELTDWKNRTLTVYGLGSIGEEIAERGLAFEMNVYGVKRNPDDYNGCLPTERVISKDVFHNILSETELLVVTVPLTEETRSSINTAVFQALPNSAILINVARGSVVDEAALINALRMGELAGAGLDVFETEPLPKDSPLWTYDNVIITPHIGGRSNAFPDRFSDFFAKNYKRWQQNKTLINQIV